MLVYLDTSQLVWLDTRRNADDAEWFSREWSRLGCTLALTVHHLRELFQVKDRSCVPRRVNLLERFPSIRFAAVASAGALEYEVFQQMLSQARGGELDFRPLCDAFFPPAPPGEIRWLAEQVFTPSVVNDIRAMEEDAAELANTIRAELPELDALVEVRRGRPPVSEMEFTPEQVRRAHARVDPSQPGVLVQLAQELYRGVPRSRDRQREDRREQVREMGVEGLFDPERFPPEDLHWVCGFFRIARALSPVVAAATGASEPGIARGLKDLDPYAGPGFRLFTAFRRALDTAAPRDEAGNFVDTYHLVQAPYADLAFVDRRVWDHLHSETRRKRPRAPLPPLDTLARAKDLRDTIAVIESRISR